jgi:3-hydroxybutyryl-CoA dehydratase
MGAPLLKETKGPSEIRAGDQFVWERSFSPEEVGEFAKMTGDRGKQQTVPDSLGRLMVHGLLTASLPTKIGGDLNFIARQMNLEFLSPVYAKDSIRCEILVRETLQDVRGTRLVLDICCSNQVGKEVLRGMARGIIPL